MIAKSVGELIKKFPIKEQGNALICGLCNDFIAVNLDAFLFSRNNEIPGIQINPIRIKVLTSEWGLKRDRDILQHLHYRHKLETKANALILNIG